MKTPKIPRPHIVATSLNDLELKDFDAKAAHIGMSRACLIRMLINRFIDNTQIAFAKEDTTATK